MGLTFVMGARAPDTHGGLAGFDLGNAGDWTYGNQEALLPKCGPPNQKARVVHFGRQAAPTRRRTPQIPQLEPTKGSKASQNPCAALLSL